MRRGRQVIFWIILVLPAIFMYIYLKIWFQQPIQLQLVLQYVDENLHEIVSMSDTQGVMQVLAGTDKILTFIPVNPNVVTLEDGSQCNFTRDISSFNQSDVLLLNVGTIFNRTGLPAYRPPGQRWVAYSRESPYHTPTSFPEGTFNHTMTYLPNADIPLHYGECIPVKNKSLINVRKNYAAHKRNLVAWFVSNCGGQSGRLRYVNHLKKHIPVHIYGTCGNRLCAKNNEGCDTLLKDNYKFYLAFENSLCRGYMTEKVFRAYESEVVPVVMGALDYSEYLPEGSYLHVADYEDPESLARHVMELDANDTLYNEMFKWRTKYHCASISSKQYAHTICRYLHQTKSEVSHNAAFSKHFNKTELCIDHFAYMKKLGYLSDV